MNILRILAWKNLKRNKKRTRRRGNYSKRNNNTKSRKTKTNN